MCQSHRLSTCASDFCGRRRAKIKTQDIRSGERPKAPHVSFLHFRAKLTLWKVAQKLQGTLMKKHVCAVERYYTTIQEFASHQDQAVTPLHCQIHQRF